MPGTSPCPRCGESMHYQHNGCSFCKWPRPRNLRTESSLLEDRKTTIRHINHLLIKGHIDDLTAAAIEAAISEEQQQELARKKETEQKPTRPSSEESADRDTHLHEWKMASKMAAFDLELK